MKRTAAAKLPETVCFRLPPSPYMAELVQRATTAKVSPGECARQILTEHLDDAQRERIESELSDLRTEVMLLRGDLATAVEALLVLVGAGNVGPAEASAWVEERLRQARPQQEGS